MDTESEFLLAQKNLLFAKNRIILIQQQWQTKKMKNLGRMFPFFHVFVDVEV